MKELKEQGKTMVFVTHNMSAVKELLRVGGGKIHHPPIFYPGIAVSITY